MSGTRVTDRADAVVIGSGPNGLVAANALAEAGWDVIVLEAQATVGGAVRSSEDVAPGYTTDLFSAFYPLAAASPVIRDLELHRHGLVWTQAPTVLAHVLDDGRAALLHRDPAATAAGFEEAGDGEAWLAMYDHWEQVRDTILDALFTPFPPVRAGARLARILHTAGLLRLARMGLLPVRRLGEEEFRGDAPKLLLTGNALHADIPPDAAGSGIFGWLLSMLGQEVGFPVPEGGAGRLAGALRERAESHGAQVRVNSRVTRVEVRGGRAIGVRLADGTAIAARRAVLADTSAPALYRRLLDPSVVPERMLRDLEHFQWDHGTLKLNWALGEPLAWTASEAGSAGTVHLGVDMDGTVEYAADLSVGRLPERPLVILGQMSTADPTRSPAGTESAWGYTHMVAHPSLTAQELRAHVDRVEDAVERVAPGFRDRVVGRLVQNPGDLQSANANLVGGAINGGTASIHQQLVFRPSVGLGRPETPIEGLYLAGASAHPSGGVHGAAGWNAARSALRSGGPAGAARRALVRTAWARVLGD